MYGLVNRAIKEHVYAVAGESEWERVCERANLDDDVFISMDPYDDDLTYRLVDAASEVLNSSPEDILAGFGRYWILYTGCLLYTSPSPRDS